MTGEEGAGTPAPSNDEPQMETSSEPSAMETGNAEGDKPLSKSQLKKLAKGKGVSYFSEA